MEDRKIIWIVAGGTGGHLYPGVAIAREIMNSRSGIAGAEVLFVVRKGDLGQQILRHENFPVIELPGQGLSRTPNLKWFTFPIKMISAFVGAWRLLVSSRPILVLGMGGYMTFPVLLAARLRGIKTMIHEQNVMPGLANRLTACFAGSVALSFEESRRYFPSGKTWVSGLPVRSTIGQVSRESAGAAFQLPDQVFTFLVFGGSQGSHRLNVIMLEVWRAMMGLGAFQVIHIAGQNDYDYLSNLYRGFSFRSKVMPYCHQMAEAYAAADVVICRAGASTVAELMAARRPAVFVPYPYASNDHQTYNAKVLQSRSLAFTIPESELSPDNMLNVLIPLLQSPEKTVSMRMRFDELHLPSLGVDAARKMVTFMR